MASEESTLFLHRGFLGPPLRPQVTMEERRGWGLGRFWRRPIWGNWSLREPIVGLNSRAEEMPEPFVIKRDTLKRANKYFHQT